MKKEIKGYIFVQDAFGSLPVWSLMHPIKEAKEAYGIINYLPRDKPNWLKTLIKLSKMRVKIENSIETTPANIVDVRVWGIITYSNHLDRQYIDDLKMDYWSIEGTITQ